MPKATWTQWFNALLSKVKKDGFLIFTTHGWLSRKYLGFPEFDDDGFWFAKNSEQKDLDKSEYGLSMCTPLFVFQQTAMNLTGDIVFFREGFWWEHQDIYIVKHRDSMCKPTKILKSTSPLLTFFRKIMGFRIGSTL